MSEKQIKMRQALLALYLEVPESVAKDVTNVVMDAIDELEKEISGLRDRLEPGKETI